MNKFKTLRPFQITLLLILFNHIIGWWIVYMDDVVMVDLSLSHLSLTHLGLCHLSLSHPSLGHLSLGHLSLGHLSLGQTGSQSSARFPLSGIWVSVIWEIRHLGLRHLAGSCLSGSRSWSQFHVNLFIIFAWRGWLKIDVVAFSMTNITAKIKKDFEHTHSDREPANFVLAQVGDFQLHNMLQVQTILGYNGGGFIGQNGRRFSGPQFRRISGPQLRGISGSQLRGIPGPQLRRISEPQLRGISGPQLKEMFHSKDSLFWKKVAAHNCLSCSNAPKGCTCFFTQMPDISSIRDVSVIFSAPSAWVILMEDISASGFYVYETIMVVVS